MTNPIENRVDTIFIHVSDLERSIQWYSNLLGIEVIKTKHTGPVYTFNMGEGTPGLTLDSHCDDENYKLSPSNQPLFNFSTSDINRAFHHVSEMGAEIITDIIKHSDLSEFSIKDPDGNILMICTCFS